MGGFVMDDNLPVIIEDVPAIVGDNLIAMADAAEKRISAVKRIKAAALAVTNPKDWTDLGGKPYLEVSGSQKVGRLFGISWQLDKPERVNDDDGYYSYTVKGYFSLGTATIEAIGARSARDPFYSKSKDTIRPISEIDYNDVMKGAITNCIGLGVTSLLGIRNLTWEEVRASVGDAAGRDKKVTYTQSEGKTEDQRGKIWEMLLEVNDGDIDRAAAKLQEITTWTNDENEVVAGKTDVSKLTARQVPVIYGKVKTAYDTWAEAMKGDAA